MSEGVFKRGGTTVVTLHIWLYSKRMNTMTTGSFPIIDIDIGSRLYILVLLAELLILKLSSGALWLLKSVAHETSLIDVALESNYLCEQWQQKFEVHSCIAICWHITLWQTWSSKLPACASILICYRSSKGWMRELVWMCHFGPCLQDSVWYAGHCVKTCSPFILPFMFRRKM